MGSAPRKEREDARGALRNVLLRLGRFMDDEPNCEYIALSRVEAVALLSDYDRLALLELRTRENA